jgi:Uma2 family endonuclease
MVVLLDFSYISAEEYMTREHLSQSKHEYKQGYVYAMAGASDSHNAISGNLYSLIKNHLRGKICRVYLSDMKVRIDKLDIYYYPDVMVTCDPVDATYDYFKKSPCLIIEVQSSSTANFDQNEKFDDYAQIESLQEYVIVSQNRTSVKCFRRNSENLWVLHPYKSGDRPELKSIDFITEIENVYEDVIFPELASDRLPSTLEN